MDKKKLIRWSFWPILMVLLIVGYFLALSPPANKHLDYIPSEAQAVVVIDSKLIAHDYYQLLKFNPTAIDEVLTLPESDEEMEVQLPGIVPLEKIVMYVFKDEATGEHYKCFMCSINNKEDFLSTFKGKRDEEPKTKELNGGSVLHYKRNNKLMLFYEDVACIMEPQNKQFQIGLSDGERHHNLLFGEGHKGLMASDESFKELMSKPHHMSIWTHTGEGLMSGMGGDALQLNNIFESQGIYFDLQEDQVGASIISWLNAEGIFNDNGSKKLEMDEDELMKLSMTVNAEHFDNFFDMILPGDKGYWHEGWNGSICTSIVGFRTDPICQIVQKSIVDTNTFETYFVNDTIELLEGVEVPKIMKDVNLPEFTTAFELDQIDMIISKLNADSTLTPNEFGWTYSFPSLVDEHLYLKTQENSLVISTQPIEDDYHVDYTTFSFSMHIDDLLSEYPPKDMFQTIVIPAIRSFEFNQFEIHSEKIDGTHLELTGGMQMGDPEIHTMLKMIPFVYNVVFDF